MVKEISNHLVPVAYLAYWIILLAIVILMLCYWTFRSKTGRSGSDTKLLAGVLVLLVVILYAIDQLPVLHTHFDVVRGKFVAGYHESSMEGFVRFWYKVGIAILLLIYAFSGAKKQH